MGAIARPARHASGMRDLGMRDLASRDLASRMRGGVIARSLRGSKEKKSQKNFPPKEKKLQTAFTQRFL
jgi:hypothetical protein